MAQPGALVTIGAEYGSFLCRSVTVVADNAPTMQAVVSTIGDNWWRNGPFPCRTMNADIRRTVQHTGHYVWTKGTAAYLISAVRRANARRSASGDDGDQYAGPCPIVHRRVDRWDDGVVDQATDMEITHEDVEMLRRFVAAFLTVVFELPLSDVTVVDGGKAVLECRVGHACRRGYVVRRRE